VAADEMRADTRDERFRVRETLPLTLADIGAIAPTLEQRRSLPVNSPIRLNGCRG